MPERGHESHKRNLSHESSGLPMGVQIVCERDRPGKDEHTSGGCGHKSLTESVYAMGEIHAGQKECIGHWWPEASTPLSPRAEPSGTPPICSIPGPLLNSLAYRWRCRDLLFEATAPAVYA